MKSSEKVAAQRGLTSEDKHAPRPHPLTTTTTTTTTTQSKQSRPARPPRPGPDRLRPQLLLSSTVSSLQPPCCVHVQLAL